MQPRGSKKLNDIHREKYPQIKLPRLGKVLTWAFR